MLRFRTLVGRQPFNAPGMIAFAVYGSDASSPKFSAAQPAVFQDQAIGESVPTLFSLDIEACQELMDQLWGVGCRPSDIGGAGQMKSLSNHLEDMRAIAFKKTGVEMPKKG